jgi:hypothetical protein
MIAVFYDHREEAVRGEENAFGETDIKGNV